MVELFKNKSEDFTIIEMMKQYKEQFKNEKFVGKLVETLTNENFNKTNKTNKTKKT